MELTALQVLHWRGGKPPSPADRAARSIPFTIDTCQRRISVGIATSADATRAASAFGEETTECFVGVAAYEFLLRVCCGLESRLLAETEIFCQMKQSWAKFATADSPLRSSLSPWMQRLFQDVKEIRAEHLCKLGSSSYGSQVRRLLRGSSRTLLVGAGQLARAVAPWLAGSEILIWNRTAERALELQHEMRCREPHIAVQVVAGDRSAELAAWRCAQQVVVCIPPDSQADQERVSAWRGEDQPGRRIVHLGAGAKDVAPWQGMSEVIGLEAVFEILHEQSETRARQVTRSRAACTEKARLRGLHAHGLPSHSWEDLEIFQ
jgi:hypothetical protein